MVAAKIGGDLASRCGQPPVLGQLMVGLGLGLAMQPFTTPEVQAADAVVGQLANLGVILLMFLAGLETDWDQLRAAGKAAFVSASFGVAVPLIGGYALAVAFGLSQIQALFVGVILTATSVSISAQTLMELGSLQTMEGATILGAAVIDDVIGLVVFSLVVALTGSSASGAAQGPGLIGLGAYLLLFFGASAWLLPRLIDRLLVLAERLRGTETMLGIAVGIGLMWGVAAERAGLAAITGAYVAGLLMNRHNAYEEITERTKVLAYGFFVPIFLVKTGMDAHVDALGPVLAFVAASTCMAVLAKIVGCGFGARLCGLNVHQSLVVGVGMISRGEVALVVATLALASGAITQSIFGATVIVVVATTLVTPPLLRLALRHASSAQRGILLVSDAV
ncbi:MAG TPA: cation:proton antiporter [Chloroflexota bacterium]